MGYDEHMTDVTREYQRHLVAAINAELGARGWSRRHLAAASGILPLQLDRIFTLKRDLNVTQLGLIADAMHIPVAELVSDAARWRERLPEHTQAS